ncbi:hypothetical protein B0T25DRAFT_214953 [Lasiosphaeria hispida]|uniref:Uncharacterized protein n=1 Tax=Lasiosphaeria hispida TaxID=260671 RepID=A0AAJ0HJ17_9PEZI|nr:hypothetical protein B0T25DRAFT_214953 [Lasiosphaeria hispida]
MAAFIESSAQFERDLRSANKEWRRSKDSSTKWSHGIRPAAGVRLSVVTSEPITGSESQQAKFRPHKRLSDASHAHQKKDQNLVKMRSHWDVPVGRVRAKLYAKKEISDASRSLGELPPPSLARKMSVSDNVLYSFDRTDTPGRPLTLDVFVRTTGREMERFVEKEYEILDTNGEALKGRKARRNLRQTTGEAGAGVDRDEDVEVDGFELV